MPPTKTAPYGSWKSPITSDLIVAQTTMLSEVRLAGGGDTVVKWDPTSQQYVQMPESADK